MKLIIGTKTYSSWSMRPWMALVEAGLPFEEEVIALRQPDSGARISAVSPNRQVPVLVTEGLVICETIAILEYLADRFPDAGLWPENRLARAHARMIAAEMHAGFVPLRQHCPMNFERARTPRPRAVLPEPVAANIARIQTIWSDTRARFAHGGPFLFGARFGAADAMYAPVVHRFHAYAIPLDPVSAAYSAAIRSTRAYQRWEQEAALEPKEWLSADTLD